MKLNTLKTVEDFEQLKKGQAIYVSDGEIEPPKHHKKKHRIWGLNNYKGFVHRFGYSCGRYEITIDRTGKGGMVYCYRIDQLTFQVEESILDMSNPVKRVKVSGIDAAIQSGDESYVHLWLSTDPKVSPVFSLYLDFKTGTFSSNDKISEEKLKSFTDTLNAEAIKEAVWPIVSN